MSAFEHEASATLSAMRSSTAGTVIPVPPSEYESRGPAIRSAVPRRAFDRAARAGANSWRSERLRSSRRSWKRRSSFGVLEERRSVAERESDGPVPLGTPARSTLGSRLYAVTVVPRLVAPSVDSLYIISAIVPPRAFAARQNAESATVVSTSKGSSWGAAIPAHALRGFG